MIDAGTYGSINWVDLSTPDVAASVAFYGELLGWDFSTSTTPMGEYTIAKVGEREVAGMMEQDPASADGPPVWTLFFYVEDMGATLLKVKAAGGTVLEAPFDIPDGPRICVVTDPTGAMLALLAGGVRPEGEYLFASPGAVCWFELSTDGIAAAELFYTSVFGWTGSTLDVGTKGYTMFTIGGEDVAGMKPLPDDAAAANVPYWITYFVVADCAAAERSAVELGGAVLRRAVEIPEGRYAILADPHGAAFAVMEYTL
ncbi:MAG: VOC family protein [Acidimicrobiia bacterium]|nr:VOC family protein [Acidimicrobiia bacterium]